MDVVSGEVTLRAQWILRTRVEAERVAKETDGVKKVTNQLKVSPASAKPANANKANANKGKTN